MRTDYDVIEIIMGVGMLTLITLAFTFIWAMISMYSLENAYNQCVLKAINNYQVSADILSICKSIK